MNILLNGVSMFNDSIVLLAAGCKKFNVRNGYVSLFEPVSMRGTIANITCHNGYVLEGDSRRMCLNRGKWSGTAKCLGKN